MQAERDDMMGEFSRLRELAEEGFERRYESRSPELLERFEREMTIFANWTREAREALLLVRDLIGFMRERGIVTSAALSHAAGSVVCHALGVTAPDPLRHGLLSERFLSCRDALSPRMVIHCDQARLTEVADYLMRTRGGLVRDACLSERGESLLPQVCGSPELALVAEVLKRIQRSGGPAPDLEAIPPDDRAAYELIASDDHEGLFGLALTEEKMGEFLRVSEFAGGGLNEEDVRFFIPRVGASSIDELAVAIALRDPAAMGLGIADVYIGHRREPEDISYAHPRLEPILAETHGVIVFQEQVMRIAAAVAGFTLAEANEFRRALGRKNGAELKSWRYLFMAGAARGGMDKAVADRIYEELSEACAYALCKAWAVATALAAYRSAYIKAHYRRDDTCVV